MKPIYCLVGLLLLFMGSMSVVASEIEIIGVTPQSDFGTTEVILRANETNKTVDIAEYSIGLKLGGNFVSIGAIPIRYGKLLECGDIYTATVFDTFEDWDGVKERWTINEIVVVRGIDWDWQDYDCEESCFADDIVDRWHIEGECYEMREKICMGKTAWRRSDDGITTISPIREED